MQMCADVQGGYPPAMRHMARLPWRLVHREILAAL